MRGPRSILVVLALGASCAANDPAPEGCTGHDGGDGGCVDVGECAAGFDIEPTGRCSRWREVAPMPVPSVNGFAARLLDGRVLVAGGVDGVGYLDSAAVFDPQSETWTAAATMNEVRGFGISLTLASGLVLVSDDGTGELYDPVADEWITLASGLWGSEPCGFIDGAGRARVHSGGVADGVVDEEARSWHREAGPNEPRNGARAHALADGSAVLIGGHHAGGFVSSLELFDPTVADWVVVADSPALARADFTSGVLGNGKLVVAGGWNGSRTLGSSLVIDLVTFEIELGPPLAALARFATGLSLADGSLLIVGGGNDEAGVLADAQLFQPDASLVQLTPYPIPITDPYMVELQSGAVLVVGGGNADGAQARAFLLERGL